MSRVFVSGWGSTESGIVIRAVCSYPDGGQLNHVLLYEPCVRIGMGVN